MAKVDYSLVRRHCARVGKKLFDEFDKRKSVLLDVSREFYPLGVAGLEKSVENLADCSEYDEEHRLLTSIPMDCLRKGAAGFHGNLTSPARRWFKFRMPSFLMKGGRSTHQQRDLLDRLTEATEWVMSRANVYSSLYKLYEHCLVYGFGAMIVSPDPDRVIKAQTLRVGTYALGIGEDGQVNRCVRKFAWTGEQIIRTFGDNAVPDDVKKAAKCCDQSKRWVVNNLIEPNAVGNYRVYDKVAKAIDLDDSMIYRSIYWLDCANDTISNSGVLKITGFKVEPLVCPRMDCELGDTYGRGRGIDGLDLARGCQSFRFDTLNISGMRAQPSVIASAEFKETGLKLGRGQVNYAKFGEQQADMVVPTLPNPPDATDTRLSAQDAANELKDLFFNTAFATIDALKNNTGVKTATEVDALVRENMERLAPIVTNFDKELLDPLVSIVVKYTLSNGIAPVDPEEVQGLGSINIEYVSQIHLAQKQSSISSVQTFSAFVAGLAQAGKPEALDKMSTDGVVDKFAEMIGVPESCIEEDETVANIRAVREAQEQAAQQMQMAQVQAQSAKTLAEIPTDDVHAGGEIMKGLGR